MYNGNNEKGGDQDIGIILRREHWRGYLLLPGVKTLVRFLLTAEKNR